MTRSIARIRPRETAKLTTAITWFLALARLLPLTHGLARIRYGLTDNPAGLDDSNARRRGGTGVGDDEEDPR